MPATKTLFTPRQVHQDAELEGIEKYARLVSVTTGKGGTSALCPCGDATRPTRMRLCDVKVGCLPAGDVRMRAYAGFCNWCSRPLLHPCKES